MGPHPKFGLVVKSDDPTDTGSVGEGHYLLNQAFGGERAGFSSCSENGLREQGRGTVRLEGFGS